MARPNILIASLPIMQAFFQAYPLKAFTNKRLQTLIDDQKTAWNIPYHRQSKDVIKFLMDRGLFIKTSLYLQQHEIELYSWKTNDEFTIISGLKKNAYYIYYSALFLHGLTQQLPKTYYLNDEHHSVSRNGSVENKLSQAGIDAAFAKEQRKSETIYTFESKKIILTNTKNTSRLGVIKNENEQQLFFFTDLERTLIDCTVRPSYSGGVFEILEAYRQARPNLDVKKLREYLDHLDYTYPYCQSIGFIMERAGYPEADTRLFYKKKEFNFYLTYNIRNKEYDERWGLFYPRGF